MNLRAFAYAGLCISILPTLTHPQGGPGREKGGWGPHSAYQRMYNPKTVESFQGTVLAVDTITAEQRGHAGIHLRVNRKKDTIDVHLGPQWYLENQEMMVSAGDSVRIKGSKVTYNDKPAVIAAEVTRGKDVLVLRDEKGFPYWSGWRRRK